MNLLVLVDVETGAVHRTPVPNVYDDGRICFGDVSLRNTGSFEDAISWFSAFNIGEVNTDLIHAASCSKSLLWDSNGVQIPDPEWRVRCPRVGLRDEFARVIRTYCKWLTNGDGQTLDQIEADLDNNEEPGE